MPPSFVYGQGIARSAEHLAAFEDKVRPVLASRCYTCHGSERARADLRLDRFTDVDSVARETDTWVLVRDRLRQREMPPPGADAPTDTQRAEIIAWIEAELASTPCSGDAQAAGLTSDPGRVTLRRLNRVEYENTIRDLFGVELDLIDEFPADDSGYGFDNIGDVLTIPPMLMERYLTIAERVSQTVIAAPEPPSPIVRRFAARQFQQGGNRRAIDHETRVLSSNGEIHRRVRFPTEGRYTIRVTAYAQQAGPDPARMAVRLDGADAGTIDVPAERKAPGTYTLELDATPGLKTLALAFVNDYYQPKHEDEKLRGDRNLYLQHVEIEAPPPAAPDADAEAHRRIMLCQAADEPEANRGCARRIIAPIARRAFRRPVTAKEVERLARLAALATAEGESFERSIQLAIQGILTSPHFLFLVEEPPDPWDIYAPGIYALNDHELASRVSYFLWSSMPDDTLLELADQGRLHSDEALEAQAVRMLADPKAERFVRSFAGQWLELRKLDDVRPDPEHFKAFDEPLREAMRQETESLFRSVIQEDRSVFDLLTCDYTFVNERLARHYGIPGIEGPTFRRVPLDSRRPGGVLAHASVLTITSDPTRTSPVKRGKWVLEQLLGTPPPPPPPDVPPLPEGEGVEKGTTLRERLELHQVRPDCRSCHSRMDPIGLALENFDAIGAWRDKEGDAAVDATGTLPTGESFDGPTELLEVLSRKKALFRENLAEKTLTFALGRGLEYYDACTVRAICETLEANGDRFSTLIVEIVKSDPFRLRALPRTES